MNEISFTNLDLIVVSPALCLAGTGFLVVVLSLALRRSVRTLFLGVALAGLALAAFLTVRLWDGGASAFNQMLLADNFALTFNLIFFVGAALSMLLVFSQHEQGYLLYAEFFAVTLFATVGMVLMAASTNLLIIFLGLETLSISLYILAGLKRTEPRSLEAAFKYFLLGAFASAFLLYGVAFLYGVAGSLDLRAIARLIASASFTENPLLILGTLLILIGLGFKVAIFPFHLWAPDVYQGAPTPITAFMSTGSKAAGFAAMLRVLFSATNGTAPEIAAILAVVAVLTMSVGNLAAIVQTNIKRMLAYSSVAHAGYILVGLVAWNEIGAASVIFYLLAYTFMNIGAFAVVSFLATKEKETLELRDFRGLVYRGPWIALVMAVFMFALAGLPPTAGFVGKFYLFSAAVKAGYIPLVILAVINSMVALYYYLGVVVLMFMKEPEKPQTVSGQPVAVAVSLALAVLGSLGLGLFPSYFMETLERVMSYMM
ncbi:MAG: NADH-quinone oxidoreductase subunit N [bacterium]